MEGFNFSHKEPQISSLPQFASWFSVGNMKVTVCRYCNDKYCMEMNEWEGIYVKIFYLHLFNNYIWAKVLQTQTSVRAQSKQQHVFEQLQAAAVFCSCRERQELPLFWHSTEASSLLLSLRENSHLGGQHASASPKIVLSKHTMPKNIQHFSHRH